jgi:GrpB-like predicted nucleotidyltransferase (UPF0157 family)
VRVLCPYDPTWANAFETEAFEIRKRLGDAARAVHHIGSTSVPGLIAKPVIDILVETGSLGAIDSASDRLMGAGYEVRGEYGIAGRRYFSRRGNPGFHVHAYEAGTESVIRHLAFRDYLRANPDAAQAYAALKLSLADASGNLPADYPDRKAAFVVQTERAALLFAAEKRR